MSTTLPPLPEPHGYIADGRPDGLEFRHAPFTGLDALLRSISPVFTDADMHAYARTAIATLTEEVERLNSALRYEQHRAGRIGTHGPGCWKWGPAHYECAVAEAARVREAAQALLGMAEGFSPLDVCSSLHHSKRDRHGDVSACPVAARFVARVNALRAALAAPAEPVAVPAGWKLVPVEPTDEMLDEAQARVDDLFRVDAYRAYSAMLTAAPAAPAASAEPLPTTWTAVYLVATGGTHNGQETYTRHDAPPPLREFERMWSQGGGNG